MNSDDDMLRRVDSALRRHPHLRSAMIQHRHAGDRVILSGAVDSFFIKQMAQEAIRGVDGAPRIENRLVVRAPHPARSGEGAPY